MDQNGFSKRGALLAFGVGVVTWLLSLANGYTHDDTSIAVAVMRGGAKNPFVHELLPLTEYFTSHYWAGSLESDVLFRPITVLSYALRGATIGDVAWVDHAINVLLHGFASYLVLPIVRLCGASARAATWAALGFAVMAVHAEAVANVVGRAELFAFCFGAAGMLVALRTRGLAGLVGATLLFFAAFCSKESAVAWFPFTLVIAWSRRGVQGGERPEFRSAVIALVPALVAWIVLRQNMISGLTTPPPAVAFTTNPLFDAAPLARVAGGIEGLGLGALLTLCPAWLSSEWGLAIFDPESLPSARTALAATALGAWLVLGIRAWRSRGLLFYSVVAFFGFALPISNIPLPIGVSFGERLYYIPSMGIAIALAFLVDRFASKRAVTLAIALWMLGNFAVAQWRTPHWKDSRTLFLTDVERQPRSVNLQLFALLERTSVGGEAELKLALEHARTALQINYKGAAAWTALAGLQSGAGATKEAIGSLKMALCADNYENYRHGDLIWNNLGSLYLRQGQDEEAIQAFVRALMENRYRSEAFVGLVRLYEGKRLEGEVFERLLRQTAAIPSQARYAEIWDTYRILAKRVLRGSLSEDERARLRAVEAALPRGTFADGMRRMLRTTLERD